MKNRRQQKKWYFYPDKLLAKEIRYSERARPSGHHHP